MSNDMKAARAAIQHIKEDNLPSRYTVLDGWQIRRDDANMNWMVYQKREVKNQKTKLRSVKWVHTGSYHEHFGDALVHIYDRAAGTGADKRTLKMAIKHFDNLYVQLKGCLPMTGEEKAFDEYNEAKRKYAKELEKREYEELKAELRRREKQMMESE